MRIYVASSWRNIHQPGIVTMLKRHGHSVYDFRNPEPGNTGFQWSAIDKNWQHWTPKQYKTALTHEVAQEGFDLDINALAECGACLLVAPCGRSSHLELGFAVGSGKRTAIYIPQPQEPELMYKMAGRILLNEGELDHWVKDLPS